VEVLIAISVFGFVSSLTAAVLLRPESSIRRRLMTFREMALVDEPLEEEESFVERVVRPLVAGTMRLATVVLPSSVGDKLEAKLARAGSPVGLAGLVVIWAACGVGLPLLYAALVMAQAGFGEQQLLMLAVVALLGLYLPYAWLNIKTGQRQTAILKALPDAIDLLSTSVEAGLGVDAALAQVADKSRGPIAAEIRRILREMAMGSTRRDALLRFADRTGLPDVKVFVNALIQAEQMGVSLGQVIRVQAEQLRMRRRQRAEQAAHAAPVKITIPLVLFIFPTILVVVLGPAVIQLIENLGSE
jgi:tight adherence protein C